MDGGVERKSFEPVGDDTGRLGSRIHRYMQQKAKAWYQRQNCVTEPEKGFIVDGQRAFVDLAVTWPDGETEALEVETVDGAQAIKNIKKNLILGFATISVLTPNRKVRDAIKKRAVSHLNPADLRKVQFPSMSFYEQGLN